jgi:deazaflavin-dependent oxidoreductase (nitroreductase family)
MTEIDTDDRLRALGRSELATDNEALRTFNDNVVAEFRANGGKVGGPLEGADVVLLTMTGAKSGRPRLTPLEYLTIDGRIIIGGSYGGAPKDPTWVHNLRANAKAHAEIGAESYDVTARELTGDERDVLFAKVVKLAARFAEYQAKTTRAIPFFELQKT